MTERCIGLQKIARARGLMLAISKRLKITRGAVYLWKYVPDERLAVVAEMSGLPIAELTRDRPAECRAKINGTARRKRTRRRR